MLMCKSLAQRASTAGACDNSHGSASDAGHKPSLLITWMIWAINREVSQLWDQVAIPKTLPFDHRSKDNEAHRYHNSQT